MIRKAIRYIKIFYKLTFTPSVIVPTNLFGWSDGDSKDLKIFCDSNTGKKLVKILQNIEAETNAKAIMDDKNTSYSAGVAFGARSMLAHFFAQSATNPQPNQGDEYDELRVGIDLDSIE